MLILRLTSCFHLLNILLFVQSWFCSCSIMLISSCQTEMTVSILVTLSTVCQGKGELGTSVVQGRSQGDHLSVALTCGQPCLARCHLLGRAGCSCDEWPFSVQCQKLLKKPQHFSFNFIGFSLSLQWLLQFCFGLKDLLQYR